MTSVLLYSQISVLILINLSGIADRVEHFLLLEIVSLVFWNTISIPWAVRLLSLLIWLHLVYPM